MRSNECLITYEERADIQPLSLTSRSEEMYGIVLVVEVNDRRAYAMNVVRFCVCTELPRPDIPGNKKETIALPVTRLIQAAVAFQPHRQERCAKVAPRHAQSMEVVGTGETSARQLANRTD